MAQGFSTVQLAPAVGAIVTGIDLGSADDETIGAIIALLHARGVVAVRGQHLDNAAYLRFARHFGRPLEFFLAEHRDQAFPEIIRIGNDPATPTAMRDGAVHWHSDSSYEEEPAAITMLYGIESPDEGGETHFASTAAAYEALDAAVQARIDALIAVHELGRAPWIEGETQPDPDRPARDMLQQHHPLVMRHPVTGRKGIFTSGTACGIVGMEPEEAVALIRDLRTHIARPEFQASYSVMPGDLLLWDNFSTVHCASPIAYSSEPGKRRSLLRISTKGMPASCRLAAA